MKILLYLEAEQFLSHSGIGRAMKHQQRALDLMGIDWTKILRMIMISSI